MQPLAVATTLTACVAAAVCAAAATPLPSVSVVTSNAADHDVLGLVCGAVVTCHTYASLADAAANTTPSGGILALNDGYPTTLQPLGAAALKAAALKQQRLFVELPASGALPGVSCTPLSAANYYHRAVATPAAPSLLPALSAEPLSIGLPDGSFFTAVSCDANCTGNSAVVYDKVAGVTRATFGLTAAADQNPLLFFTPGVVTGSPQVLASATQLSQPVARRYTPVGFWAAVWSGVLSHVAGHAVTVPTWQPLVHPRFSASQPLPATAVSESFVNVTNWLTGSQVFVSGNTTACPAPFAANASEVSCVLEGYSAVTNVDGTQKLAASVRTDCNAEAAMALALRARHTSSPAAAAAASRLLRYVFTLSTAQQGPQANASNPAYGLLAWGMSPGWTTAFYGDDDARSMLGLVTATAALGTDAYDAALVRALVSNLRLASVHGFRPGRVNLGDLEANGWQHYATSNAVYANTSSPQPHYQSRMWSAFLLAHNLTGFTPFLDRARAGLDATMAVLLNDPTKFVWTEMLSEELVALITPLSWLLRVEDTPTVRGWLAAVIDPLLARTVRGGIREFFGPGPCADCPPSSNAAYGSGEGPLLMSNNDTVSDLLYSTNFYAHAIQEAAAATGNTTYAAAAAGVVDFLVRVQAASQAVPHLDGGYMRGFNLDLWAIGVASGTDWGWGPFSQETGWSATWAAQALYTNITGECLWDVATTSSITPALFASVCPTMLPASMCPVGNSG